MTTPGRQAARRAAYREVDQRFAGSVAVLVRERIVQIAIDAYDAALAEQPREERQGETPDCNCASRGMLEGTRHGLNCPYGKRLAQEFIAEQERKQTPPVEDMTCEEALAEAQAQAHHWRERALAAHPLEARCTICQTGVPHLYHWYDGCTCAAGGAYEDHSSHCALHGCKLIADDELLVERL